MKKLRQNYRQKRQKKQVSAQYKARRYLKSNNSSWYRRMAHGSREVVRNFAQFQGRPLMSIGEGFALGDSMSHSKSKWSSELTAPTRRAIWGAPKPPCRLIPFVEVFSKCCQVFLSDDLYSHCPVSSFFNLSELPLTTTFVGLWTSSEREH